MGQPVVHFEVVGKDAKKVREFYGELAGWKFEVFEAEESATARRATRATSPSTSRSQTWEPPSIRRRSWEARS